MTMMTIQISPRQLLTAVFQPFSQKLKGWKRWQWRWQWQWAVTLLLVMSLTISEQIQAGYCAEADSPDPIPLELKEAPTIPVPSATKSSPIEPRSAIVINIPSRTLDYQENGKTLKTYPVGVGRPGFPTPLGNYRVIRRIIHPTWENPYKANGAVRIKGGTRNNPLGTRWIGFKAYKGGEYGIHGTDNPGSVGKLSSHGCVRMKIRDAEDLFERAPMDTPVLVRYDTVRVSEKQGQYYLTVYPDVYGKKISPLTALQTVLNRDYPDLKVANEPLKKTISAARPGVPQLLDLNIASSPEVSTPSPGTQPVSEKSTPEE